MTFIKATGLAVSGVLLVGGALVVLSYRRAMAAARARVEAGSRMIDTACGPVEYGELGARPPVLVIHGAGGGYDQGIARARALAHAQKKFGRRWFRRLRLIWQVESARYDSFPQNAVWHAFC